MCRHIAIALLMLMNAFTPALANACAASCVLGSSGTDMSVEQGGSEMPCHGGPQSPEEDGSGDTGSMTAMCAFAAGSAISVARLTVNADPPSHHMVFVESILFSFVSLPADKPPRT